MRAENHIDHQGCNSLQGPLVSAVDLFCGAGGLTRGLLNSGIRVVAGYDIDPSCGYAYEHNNSSVSFILKDIAQLSADDLRSCFLPGSFCVIAGCAPCQPFSKYARRVEANSNNTKWGQLNEFSRLVVSLLPEIVTMENVPQIKKHVVFEAFVSALKGVGYYVSITEAFCPDYGLPQQRKRLVLLASRLGPIALEKPVKGRSYSTVREAIGHLPSVAAGEFHHQDPLHRACRLSSINQERVASSQPGGTWRDWPTELVARCHRGFSGKTYPSVYGRMSWDQPAPTITTQFFGYGNGRFGHPDQNRALTLREGAILQSFPENYQFVEANAPMSFSKIGRLIGNAVPVRLGEAIGRSIYRHLQSFCNGGHDEQ